MSNCGYYSITKGVPKCDNPNKSYSARDFATGGRWHPCEMCKRTCGGVYPSQLPKANQEGWVYAIVDKAGNILN